MQGNAHVTVLTTVKGRRVNELHLFGASYNAGRLAMYRLEVITVLVSIARDI